MCGYQPNSTVDVNTPTVIFDQMYCLDRTAFFY